MSYIYLREVTFKMFNIPQLVSETIFSFFYSMFEELISLVANTLVNIMSFSINIMDLPWVEKGIFYSQLLAFTILSTKVIKEIFQQYILYTSGDPEADPFHVLTKTGQTVFVVSFVPWIIKQVFTFGTKVAEDVANMSSGQIAQNDWSFLISFATASNGIIILGLVIVVVIMLMVVAIQASIRGGEIALLSVLGPIIALNLTSDNTSLWSSWFKQLVIVCVSQAIQIFMLKGALLLFTASSLGDKGFFFGFGWLWVTTKTPKFVQQFAYSTGFTGTMGAGAKQAGSMYLMRRAFTKI